MLEWRQLRHVGKLAKSRLDLYWILWQLLPAKARVAPAEPFQRQRHGGRYSGLAVKQP